MFSKCNFLVQLRGIGTTPWAEFHQVSAVFFAKEVGERVQIAVINFLKFCKVQEYHLKSTTAFAPKLRWLRQTIAMESVQSQMHWYTLPTTAGECPCMSSFKLAHQLKTKGNNKRRVPQPFDVHKAHPWRFCGTPTSSVLLSEEQDAWERTFDNHL